MKNFFRLSALALFTLLFVYCNNDDSSDVTDNNTNTPPVSNNVIAEENARFESVLSDEKTTAFLQGFVTGQDAGALNGAVVSLVGTTETTTTDENGEFSFGEIELNEEFAVIKVEKEGYFDGFRTFTPTSDAVNTVSVELLKVGTPKTYTAETGATVSLADDKVKIDFPAGVMVDENGEPYAGEVTVVANYYDPTAENFLEQIPGALVGLDESDSLGALISYGMAVVELTDGQGNKIEIAKDSTVTLTLPVPNIENAPDSIPLWHFNEDNGLWIEAGIATKVGNEYIGEVSHFSTWNLDIKVDAIDVTVTFEDENGSPLANQYVKVFSEDFTTPYGGGFTTNEGTITLLRAPQILGYEIVFECETVRKTLEGGGTITINTSDVTSANIYEFSGILKSCEDSIFSNQYFSTTSVDKLVQFSGYTDENGEFSLSSVVCEEYSGSVDLVTSLLLENGAFRLDTLNLDISAQNNFEIDFCGTVSSDTIPDNFIIPFEDQNFEFLVKQYYGITGDVTYGDIKDRDSLDISIDFGSGESGLHNINGIGYFISLKHLAITDVNRIANNTLNNISEISNLPLLNSLIIREMDSLSNISPISRLTNLKELTLFRINISDISPLANLINLESLDLTFNYNISDISPLVNLTNLENLQLGVNNISDISTISNLINLKNLSLSVNNISDISPVSSLTNLEELYLRANNFSDTSPLSNLTRLKVLGLTQNNISDISPISSLTNLKDLRLYYNPIDDISSLCNLPNSPDLIIGIDSEFVDELRECLPNANISN